MPIGGMLCSPLATGRGGAVPHPRISPCCPRPHAAQLDSHGKILNDAMFRANSSADYVARASKASPLPTAPSATGSTPCPLPPASWPLPKRKEEFECGKRVDVGTWNEWVCFKTMVGDNAGGSGGARAVLQDHRIRPHRPPARLRLPHHRRQRRYPTAAALDLVNAARRSSQSASLHDEESVQSGGCSIACSFWGRLHWLNRVGLVDSVVDVMRKPALLRISLVIDGGSLPHHQMLNHETTEFVVRM